MEEGGRTDGAASGEAQLAWAIPSRDGRSRRQLKQFKSELAALDRKIQLELAPPVPEVKQQEEKPDGEARNPTNKTVDIRPEQTELIYGRREIAEPVRRIRLG